MKASLTIRLVALVASVVVTGVMVFGIADYAYPPVPALVLATAAPASGVR
jgi:hypothetical protein